MSASRAGAPRPVPLSFKLALAAIVLIVAFGMCEIVARAIYPRPPDDSRQPDIVYQYDPDIRYTHKPNQRGYIDDGLVTINSRGFRGPEPQTPKPAGRTRIVTIGDSLTLGWGVNDDETFSVALEKGLRSRLPQLDLDVVNAGVSGYNTRQEVVWLSRNLDLLTPDVVLIGLYINDVPDTGGNTAGVTQGATVVGAPQPVAGQILHLNPSHTSWSERMLRKSRAVFTLGRAYKRLRGSTEWTNPAFTMEMDILQGHDSEAITQAWAAVETQLADLARLAQQHHFRAGIVVLPPLEQVRGEATAAHYQTTVAGIAARHHLFVIDPLPALVGQAKPERLFVPYDRIHPSAAGHQLIGAAIAEYLVTHREDAMAAGAAASQSQ